MAEFPERFNILYDGNSLARLVIDAAVDVEVQRREGQADYSKINVLAELLEKASRGDMCPITPVILFPCLSQYSEKSEAELRNMRQLPSELINIANDLRAVAELSGKKLEALQKFCLSLYKEIRSYQSSVTRRLVA